MAEFEYDVTEDDLSAFNLYHLSTSDFGRRQFRTYRATLAIVTGLVGGLVWVAIDRSAVGGVVAGAIAAAAMWFRAPASWRSDIRRNVSRLSKTNGLGATGHHVLSLDENGMLEKSPTTTVTAPWSSVHHLSESDDHLFIFTDPVRAFIIPKRIGESEVAAIKQAVEAKPQGDLQSS